jgi:hypothetical protein
LLFLFGDSRVLALCGLTATVALVAMHYGALLATLQSVVKISIRAFSVSVFLVFTTVIGVGLGPVVVGATTDLLSARHAELAIRYSMIIPACTCFAGGLLLLLAIRFVQADIEKTRG